KVYGIDIEDEWDNWIEFEKKFQFENLALIRKFPVTKGRNLIDKPLGAISRAFFDKDTRNIVACVNYPGTLAHISEFNIDTGIEKKVGSVMSPMLNYVASLAYNDKDKIVFFSDFNSSFRSLNSLNLATGEEKELIEYSRMGDLAFNSADKSIWGIQVNSGRTTIAKVPYPYSNIVTIYTIPFGRSLFNLDISPDGTNLIATSSDVNGKQQVVMFDIRNLELGNQNYDVINEFEGSSASDFVFSPDGKYIYGSSYFTGVSNIYRIELSTKKYEALTNSERGYFRPIPLENDSLIIFEYTSEGMLPKIIGINPIEDINAVNLLGQEAFKANPELASFSLSPASRINLDSIGFKEIKYNEFSNMTPSALYPIIQGYKDYPAYGLKFDIGDQFYLSSLSLSALYSPNIQLLPEERFHFALDYNYWSLNFRLNYNQTDFYDLFGPIKRSRKGYMASLKYTYFYINDRKPYIGDITLMAAYFGNLDTLPAYQNVDVRVDRLFYGFMNFQYGRLRKSLGAIEPEQGYNFNLYSQNYYVNNEFITGVYSDLDIGLLTPLQNSSVWLRSSAGSYFTGDRSNLFANYYFGGFGNNYIDHSGSSSVTGGFLPSLKYRQQESFPGKVINDIGGRNYVKMLLEWCLPPLRFKKLGFLSFYSTYSRLSLFGSGLITNLDDMSLKREVLNFGSQLDFELVLFSLMKSTLSFGYGVAIEKNLKPAGEFMISLRIL
ncbi:MAG: hypothetical protein QG635_95, partial [Bacteroidota bacterium]|nr:hypothetical protein [Bacteroidota bacterium]